MKLHQILTRITLISTLTASPLAMGASLSQDQVDQVQKIIHDYLVANPQVLVEASQALQKQEMGEIEKKAQTAIAANAQALFADPSNPVTGNPKGNITIVEFFDYQCPHCKDMGPIVERAIKENAEVRFVMKELPIFGATSRDASSAALAANLQGTDKYKKLHDALLAAPNPLTKEKVLSIAKSVGLDVDKLQKDMATDAIKKQLDDNFKMAQALELVGTPTFIVVKWEIDGKNNTGQNAIFVPGVVDDAGMKELIGKAKAQ